MPFISLIGLICSSKYLSSYFTWLYPASFTNIICLYFQGCLLQNAVLLPSILFPEFKSSVEDLKKCLLTYVAYITESCFTDVDILYQWQITCMSQCLGFTVGILAKINPVPPLDYNIVILEKGSIICHKLFYLTLPGKEILYIGSRCFCGYKCLTYCDASKVKGFDHGHFNISNA